MKFKTAKFDGIDPEMSREDAEAARHLLADNGVLHVPSKPLESIARHVNFYPDPKAPDNSQDALQEFFDRISNSPMGSPQARIGNRLKKKH